MSHLLQFIDKARAVLSPAEWVFFNARYVDGRDLLESASLSSTGSADEEGAERMRLAVLHKLRGDPVEVTA